ncbi:matrixin family metalloprotease [Streptomyces sp. NP160]|uniref:matrixin family metalloprotease n=1 Tax=Streptomyces sp. NP160 TaxID=2586637 RepID=UPI001118F83F|nr:matrixin family metalloprotease [Streptomyces sp. NP160]TNM69670.1 matrixin family metalloprotease [Streptomyces sp. NP160]
MSTRARGAAAAALVLSAAVGLGGCVTASAPDAPTGSPAGSPADAATATATGPSSEGAAPEPAGDGYAVLETDESTGEPIRYSSCQPIRYVTHLDGAPAEVGPLVTEAVAMISSATGLTFVDEGATDEEPGPEREAQLAEYGEDRWAPVLIAWTDEETIPDLEGDTVGLAGSQAYTDAEGRSAYVSGDVMLDAPDLSEILTERSGEAQVRAVIAHELGHLVGLDHVEDPTQLMYAEDNPDVVEPAAGDLAGLELMGAGPCVEDLATP